MIRSAALMPGLLLAGCVTSHGIRPLRPLELATAPYVDVDKGALTGSLMYEGGCLLFRDDVSRALLLPVWPAGTIFNGTALIFHHPGKADQPVLIGEETRIEGAPMQWTALPPDYVRFQRQCAAPPFFVSRLRPAN